MSGILTPVTNNYVVGKGLVFFDQFAPNTQNNQGERFLGDCKGLNVTLKSTQLDHYQSTGGIKILDESVPTQVDGNGQLMTENVSNENVALFFFGTADTVTQAATTVTAEHVGPVIKGLYYQLGAATDPLGAQNLDSASAAVVKDVTDATTYTLGTDYAIDYVSGRIQVLVGSAIANGDVIHVTYHTLSTSKPRVVSGTTPIEGALRFVSNNVAGEQQVIYIPFARLTPNGTYDLIGDKFTEMTFDVKVLSKAGSPFFRAKGF